MGHVHVASDARPSPRTFRLVAIVSVSFVLGVMIVAAIFADPADGPAPGSTRVAAFAVCAAFAFGVWESGRLNRPLGETRLHQGLAVGALVAGLTACAAAWLRSRSEPLT